MIAPVLPATLAPPAPFPRVVSQALAQDAIAPGIRRATYDLATVAGPLVVQVVAIDPSEPSVRLGSVVAGDRLVSAGETISSMARRTNAVAGVNADYFDIGQTNQPLNLVVRDGVLLRSPSQRIVLDVRRDRSVHFENFSFHGSASYGTATVPITSLNEWPPQGGAALITSDFGPLRAAPGVRVAALSPVSTRQDGTPSGVYRVTAVDDATAHVASGVALAFGSAAQTLAAPPQTGDVVTIDAGLTPPQTDLLAAVGGGPLLVRSGAPVNDPNAPAPEERDVRFPVSGAALESGGTLLLVSVDGRQRASSIGVTRPEFGALMLALGATDAMAFDSGGSATLVARELGDAGPSVANVPSDGEERPVADGLFAYSDAPLGPPAALVVRPAPLVALPNVDVPVRLTIVDAAGHVLRPAHLAGGDFVRGVARSTVVAVRASGFVANVPVRVVPQLARLDITTDTRIAQAGEVVTLRAVGRDESGAAVALGNRAAWSADAGSFVAPGVYRAATHDARIVVRAGGASATYAQHVGSRRLALDAFGGAGTAAWTFASAPRDLPGSLAIDAASQVLSLDYDFTAGARAAYATTSLLLPGEPLSFTADVEGDASGVAVRAAFINVLGERRALTLAKSVDWTGWQTQTLALPDDLNPPVRLVALYAVPSLGGAPARTAGALRFRNLSVVIAGSQ
jgi:hypothetical protein